METLNPCRFCSEVPTDNPSTPSITCCNHTSPKDRWNGHNPLFNVHPSITFGDYIKAARQKLGMQQKDLAEQLGISNQYMNDLERDRRNPPDDDKMQALARLLNLDSDLLYWHAQRWPPDIQAKAHTIDDLNTIRDAFQVMRGALRIF